MTDSQVCTNPGTPVEQRSWPRRLLNRWEVDQAVFYAILTRAWQFISGPITIILIILYFNQIEQGYYYAFWNLIALQTFFELSFHQVIITFASHEWEKLRLAEDGSIQGDEVALSRLISLVRTAFVWYGIAALLFLAVAGTLGFVYFSVAKQQIAVAWQFPWLALVASTALTFWTIPSLAVLEGCNQVKNVYKIQCIRAALGSLMVWICIPLGSKLWTPALATCVRLTCEIVLSGVLYHRFLATFLNKPSGATIDWNREVWPFQWRLALKSIAAFFSTYLMNPVIFYFHGGALAGQLGMSWQILTSLEAACASWVKARTARFGILVSKQDYVELDRIYMRLTRISFGILVAAIASFCLFDLALYQFLPQYAVRFLPPVPTGVLAIGVVLVLIPECQWTYVHAHKQSPYLRYTFIGSLATGLLTWLLGWKFAAIGVALAYTGVMVLYYLPFSTWIWQQCRREWHAPQENTAPEPVAEVAVVSRQGNVPE